MVFYAQPSEEPGREKPFPEGLQWRVGVKSRKPGECRDLQSCEGFASRFRAFCQEMSPPTCRSPWQHRLQTDGIFLGMQGMGSWVFIEGWAEFALLLLSWSVMTHFKCPGLYRCEPELTLHPSCCCSGSQPCCSFLISRIPQRCFSHSHCKTFAVCPLFNIIITVNTVVKQLLAGLGQLLPKLSREFCCLKWLVTFSFHFHNSSTSVSFHSTRRKPGIRNLLKRTCTNFLERLKLRNPQLNFIGIHLAWLVSAPPLLQFISVIDLQSFFKALPSYSGCHHQYFLQKLDMRNSKWAVYMWIMISLSSNTKSFPIAL